MSELRKDPVTGRWVIISSERGRRPSDFQEAPPKRKGGFCPFCAGNERFTPPEILAYREPGTLPNSAGWSLRVVPNKFPALKIEGNLDKTGIGLFDKMNGIGAHEVIIENPSHEMTMSKLPERKIEDILWAYRDRVIDLKKDPRFQSILIFKNEGEAAGASLEHSHSQLIALPIIPRQVSEEIEGARLYYNYKERCIYCDIIRQEMYAEERNVAENEHFLAITPFAARFPFETWIIPKTHNACFDESQPWEYSSLARILKNVLQRLDKVLNIPPYNYIIHTCPLRSQMKEFYHWHLELIPKLIRIAGFEWGSGFYINPTSPEEAAKFLREAKVAT
ncbi:MAG TPA: galactose-1-phosphate uridylyltransferase [Nitrospirota bacterium]|nr:galactose-1-phosphate uridylyltransferase [Nitrospirota bacterium]